MHKSPIWLTTDDEFKKIIRKSNTITEVLKYFNMLNKGSNFITVKNRIQHLHVNCDHFIEGRREQARLSLSRYSHGTKKIPLNKLLVKDCKHSRSHIKERIIKHSIIPYVCGLCEQEPIWRGNPLSLRLDHIDGNSTNYIKTNLRFLCPNCDSQTATYGSKNINFKNRFRDICEICGVLKLKSQRFCSVKCSATFARSKNASHVTTKQLIILRDSGMSYTDIGKKANISDVAVRNRIKRHKFRDSETVSRTALAR